MELLLLRGAFTDVYRETLWPISHGDSVHVSVSVPAQQGLDHALPISVPRQKEKRESVIPGSKQL